MRQSASTGMNEDVLYRMRSLWHYPFVAGTAPSVQGAGPFHYDSMASDHTSLVIVKSF